MTGLGWIGFCAGVPVPGSEHGEVVIKVSGNRKRGWDNKC